MHQYIVTASENNIPIFALSSQNAANFISKLNANEVSFFQSQDFKGQNGKITILYDAKGSAKKVLFGLGEVFDAQIFGSLAKSLPKGDYIIKTPIVKKDAENCYLSFLLGAYVFDKYKKISNKNVRLYFPENIDKARIIAIANAINMGRDLINMPPNDMVPDALEAKAQSLAKAHNAQIEIIKGDELLKQNYPLIHAVGKAAEQPPRFIILKKPNKNGKKIAIIGKGVVFDTGGLNLKPSNGMGLMKKDMGGAACALCAFDILSQLNSGLDLSIYIPIVENSVSANAMRPSDIYIARNGKSVEIDNTDAEGRLILADALTKASEDGNELIIDFATLTGAARVALGPEIPPFYTKSEKLADALYKSSLKTNDYLWRMPIWDAYRDDLDTAHADIKNSGGAFAGSITAALFLQEFVSAKEWVHFDVYCWNPKDRPAHPKGGEIQAVRAVIDVLQNHYN